jgi:uncharacterized protein (DUF983 family)
MRSRGATRKPKFLFNLNAKSPHCALPLSAYVGPMNVDRHTRKWPILKRGLLGRCPNCGDAKLFRAYLKPVEHCPSCGENWNEIRADDGPAWASILVAGHFLAPFFYLTAFKTNLPDWAATSLLILAGVSICLAVLPRMKGLFIALIWVSGAPTS